MLFYHNARIATIRLFKSGSEQAVSETEKFHNSDKRKSLRMSIPLLKTQWAEEVCPYMELVTLGVMQVFPQRFRVMRFIDLCFNTFQLDFIALVTCFQVPNYY